MTTLAEHIIVDGAKNRPPILEKSMYDSWSGRIRLFIKGKKHGRMMLDSIDNGPLVYPTVEENGQTRPMKYSELTKAQQLQDDCDVQATNIILYDLPPGVYAFVNHQEVAKDIWDRVINDMHIIGMTMQQVQVNTKFLNALLSEWSKFVTDVKLAKSLYTTNYDQLYAYLSQHERHANEVRITRVRYSDPLALVANSPTLYNPPQSLQHSAEFPQLDSGLVVPTFQQGEDLIECINEGMTFLSVVALRRQSQSFAGTGNKGIATTSRGNYAVGQPKVVKCYNCQREGHMPNLRKRGQILDEEQLAFLADPGILEAPVAHQIIPQNSAFQTEDLDAYDSDCDDLSSAKAVLMANISSCDPEVLFEIPNSDSYPNDMINQDMQEMQYSEQTYIDDFQDNEIHSDSNIIPYSQYLQESQDAIIQDTNSSAPNDLLVLSLVEQMTDHASYLDNENQTNKMVNESLTTELKRYKEGVVIFEQRLNVDLNKREKLIDSQMDDLIRNRNAKLAAFQHEINTLKETLSNHRIQPILYDGSVIAKEHAVISIIDDEETLILEEEIRSNMLDKQNDPISIEKKIKISPIDYLKLNKIKEDFGNRFVTKKELSVEQAFWLKHTSFSETSITSHTPVSVEAPSELPKVSLVNESLKNLKYQLANFDNVVKKRTTSDAIIVGAWGFEHTKVCFVTEIIPFLKVLKDTFNAFDKTLLDEITEVQTVFNQMEVAVDQCSVDKNDLQIQIKHLSIDNNQLLKQIMSQEIVHIAVNSVDILDVKKSCVNDCNKYLEIKTELLNKKDLIEKYVYDKLLKSDSTLEKHCISLELTTQINQEVFQKYNFRENQNVPTFSQLFELNELTAQSQEKDTVIRKLKDRIKTLSGKDSVENLKKDIDEIETINIELE
ncbi:hypothetical protein Tco_1319378 [Tanacetum coccineum]